MLKKGTKWIYHNPMRKKKENSYFIESNVWLRTQRRQDKNDNPNRFPLQIR